MTDHATHHEGLASSHNEARGRGGAAAFLASIAVAVLLLGFYTGIIDFAFARLGLPVTPGQLSIGVTGIAGFAAMLAVLNGARPSLGFVAVPIAYLAIMTVSAAIRPQDDAVVLIRAAFVGSLPLLLISAHSIQDMRWVRRLFLSTLCLLCVVNLIDYLAAGALPVPMSDIPGRAGGFHINPNVSASLIALSLPVAALMLNPRLRTALYVLSAVAVLSTFSRGGFLLWVTALTITESFLLRPGGASTKIVIAGVMGIMIVAFVIVFGDQIASALVSVLGSYISPELASRLYLDVHDYAADQRRYGAMHALSLFIDFPFFGSGVGLVGRWSFNEFSHNMFLQTLAEFGLVGGVWILAFLAWLYRCAGNIGGALVALWCLAAAFSHNLLDSLSLSGVIVIYSLAGWGKLLHRPAA